MRNIKPLLLTLIIASNVFSGEPDEKLHIQCLYPTVMIATNEGGCGTGTIIRSDKISEKEYRNVVLTCSHVLSEDSRVLYRVYRGEYKNWSDLEKIIHYPAVVCDKNVKLDLSVLVFISSIKMNVAVLGTDVKSYIGNEIFKIGFGGEEYFRLDYGKITFFNVDRVAGSLSVESAVKINLTRHSALTLPGDSGGPVFQEYKLIGITNSVKIIRNPVDEESKMLLGHIGYFVPISALIEWNKSEKNLDFVFDSTKELPKTDFARLNLLEYQVTQ